MSEVEVTKKHLLRINYRSGLSETAWFKRFDAKLTPQGQIQSLSYEVHPDSHAFVVHVGINEIESVYRLESLEC